MKHPLFTLTTVAAVIALAGCDAKAPVAVVPAAPAPDAQASDAAPLVAPPVMATAPAPATVAPRRSTQSAQYLYVPPPPQVGGEQEYDPPQIYSAYEPMDSQPAAIAVPWAPPPMLVEAPPPPPSRDARWTGGYWVWHERWV
ncbi:MAG: hypothetical protein M3R22_11610, partial [Pseudomonadota bacterium]|nr:hypothetical protein [Pseudomonadota bacterium]